MDNVRNSHLQNYIEQTILLLRTLCIKHTDLSYLTNEAVVSKYGADTFNKNDKTTWKYYLNLAGQYHFSDAIMRVVSIDTLEEIEFTAENLAVHTATALAYQVGTRDYFLLVSKYPTQIRLIHGILYPCDITTAIESEDGAILSYQKNLVEDSEETLMYDLECYIKNVLSRWYISPFNSSNELYAMTFFTMLNVQLLQKIFNLRVARCHTREVHSFHIRMFLASHGELDNYMPYMTKEQVLWLYRNIRYIERNSGTTEQFNTLVKNILTKRNIPIAEYRVKHTDEFIGYEPGIVAKNTSLNGLSSSLSKDYHTLALLFEKEIPDAPGNEKYLSEQQAIEEAKFTNANSSVIRTKALLSSMVDYTNSVPEPFDTIAIRQWCYMSTKSLYYANIVYRDPKTTEQQSLSAKDAFIYFVYITVKTFGYEIDKIPDYLNLRQRKRPKPSTDMLLRVVPAEHQNRFRATANTILARQSNLGPCISVSAFNAQIEHLYDESYWHWCLISATEDLYDRAYVESMISQLYEDELVALSPNQISFEEWRTSLNLPEFNYDYSEMIALTKNLFSSATGITVDSTKRLTNIQRALIDLIKQLSSYSVQFIREINESDLLITNQPATRFSSPMMSMSIVRHDEVGPSTLYLEATTEQTFDLLSDNQSSVGYAQEGAEVTQEIVYDPIMDVRQVAEISMEFSDIATPTLFSATYEGQDAELEEREGVLGYTTYQQLTESQRSHLKSVF